MGLPTCFHCLGAAATLPVATPAGGEQVPAPMVMGVLLMTVIGIALAIRLQIFWPARVVGPKRLPDRGGGWALLIVALIGFLSWQFSSAIYIVGRQAELKKQGIEDVAHAFPKMFTPADYAIISTIPPVVALASMLFSLRLLLPGGLTWIGMDGKRFWRGVGYGVVAFLIIGPAMFWALAVLGVVYQKLRYEHPSEHELLTKLGQTQTHLTAALLVAGATVMAPLLEELLFRGLFQTLLRHGLMVLSGRGSHTDVSGVELTGGVPADDVSADISQTPVPLNYQPQSPTVLVLTPSPWHSWVAILVTSAAFAMMHEGWMRPVIMLLSIGLGYVYERTGILWSSIAVHFLFNALQTAQFLALSRGH